eukprot:Blabericola_migrator_1__12957@NODE_858_length_6240_cov_61_647821_g608_i0_p5_GENE_NODE_858_length_6240_cov_61_647821_g608_i0NODE_858_length_6240_cov_61_647821_g608_i0_p5_ORF_typecomplete_len179_score36_73_NODE_858_length_6240_cov_61_647821_g608_i020852621
MEGCRKIGALRYWHIGQIMDPSAPPSTSSALVQMLESDIENLSTKKFHDPGAALNFSSFQKELTTCLLSDLVIDLDDDEDNINNVEQDVIMDDDDRQILQFVNSHLRDFTVQYDQAILDSRPASGHKTDLVARSIEKAVENQLPPIPCPTSNKSANLQHLSDIIQAEIALSSESAKTT